MPIDFPIHWSDELNVGVETIDDQHRFLFVQLERIASELRATEDPIHRAGLFAELNAYARFHFLSEENLMRKAAYPLLEAHRRDHMRMVDEISARQGLMLARHIEQDSDAVLRFLAEVLLEHTRSADRRFGEFLATGEV